MGKQSNLKFRGTQGNIIYYPWRDIYCIRTKPAFVKQTENTKMSAAIFGKSVKCSALTRAMLKPVLPDPTNRSIMHRLDASFRGWLKSGSLEDIMPVNSVSYFSDFSFNDTVKLSQALLLQPYAYRDIRGQIILQLPALNVLADIAAPPGTREVALNIIGVSMPVERLTETCSAMVDLTIPYNNTTIPVQNIPIGLSAVTGNLILVAMNLIFYKEINRQNMINTLNRKPCNIVGSFYN